MNLTDTASQEYIFHAKRHDCGNLTCRHCKNQVFLQVKLRSFLVIATTKIKIVGEWCSCSDINEVVKSLIDETLGVDENVDVL